LITLEITLVIPLNTSWILNAITQNNSNTTNSYTLDRNWSKSNSHIIYARHLKATLSLMTLCKYLFNHTHTWNIWNYTTVMNWRISLCGCNDRKAITSLASHLDQQSTDHHQGPTTIRKIGSELTVYHIGWMW
jgi:hypothetical protein